jgi:hypothetical protein
MSRWARVVSFWAHAFAVDGPAEELTEADRELLHRVAAFVVRRRMATPAVMLLESSRPLTFLGSQFLHFVKPFASIALKAKEYERFAQLLERRSSVDLLLDAIAEEEGRGNE